MKITKQQLKQIIKEEISAVADLVDTPMSEQEYSGPSKEETIDAIRLRLIAEHGSDPIFKEAERLGLVDEMAKAIYDEDPDFADQEGGDILSQDELKRFLSIARMNRAYRKNPEYFNEGLRDYVRGQSRSPDVEVPGGGVRSVKGVKSSIMDSLEDAIQAAQRGDFETVATRVANLEAFVKALKKVGEIK